MVEKIKYLEKIELFLKELIKIEIEFDKNRKNQESSRKEEVKKMVEKFLNERLSDET